MALPQHDGVADYTASAQALLGQYWAVRAEVADVHPVTIQGVLAPLVEAESRLNNLLASLHLEVSLEGDLHLKAYESTLRAEIKTAFLETRQDPIIFKQLYALKRLVPQGPTLTLLNQWVKRARTEGAHLKEEITRTMVHHVREAIEEKATILHDLGEAQLALSGVFVGAEDYARLVGLNEDTLAQAQRHAAALGQPGYLFKLDAQTAETIQASGSKLLQETYYRKLYQPIRGEWQEHYKELLKLEENYAQLLGNDSYFDYAAGQSYFGDFDFLQSYNADIIMALAPYKKVSAACLKDPIDAAFKPYLSIDSALEGLNALCQHLYEVSIQSEGALWETAIQSLALTTAAGDHLATLELDLFARPGKPTGNHVHVLQQRADASEQCPQVLIQMSLDESGEMKLSDLKTFYRLWGEATLHMMSVSAYPHNPMMEGTNKELAVAFFERFASEPAYLRMITSATPMPEAFYERVQQYGLPSRAQLLESASLFSLEAAYRDAETETIQMLQENMLAAQVLPAGEGLGLWDFFQLMRNRQDGHLMHMPYYPNIIAHAVFCKADNILGTEFLQQLGTFLSGRYHVAHFLQSDRYMNSMLSTYNQPLESSDEEEEEEEVLEPPTKRLCFRFEQRGAAGEPEVTWVMDQIPDTEEAEPLLRPPSPI